MYSGSRGLWINALTAETSNINAALTWSLSAGDAEVGLRLAGALGRYWYFTGRLNQGREWLALALDSPAGRRPTPARARALYSAAKLAWSQGDYEVAVQQAEASLSLVIELGDEQLRGDALTLTGYTNMAVGRPDRALAVLQESRQLFEAAGDSREVAFAAAMSSEALEFIGDHDAAVRNLEDARAGFIRAGDRWGEAVVHVMTASALSRRGDFENVERHLSEADAIFQEMGEMYGQSRLRLLHAYLSLAREDRAQARRLFREGLSLAREIGQSAYILLILGGCAALALLSGRYVESAKLYGKASVLLEADAPHVDDGAAAARAAYARFLPHLRESLDRRSLDAAWSEGKTLPLDEALDLANAVVSDSSEREPAPIPATRPAT
jgi:tetratricopeptide (TPR) repeat protein